MLLHCPLLAQELATLRSLLALARLTPSEGQPGHASGLPAARLYCG